MSRPRRTSSNMPSSFAGITQPWHRVWEPMSEEASRNVDLAMEAGGINFPVEKRRFEHPFAKEIAEKGIMANDVFSFGVFRTDTFDQLGACTEEYQVIHQRKGFAFIEDLIGEGYRIDSCGSFKNGAIIFANVTAYETEIVPGDPVKRYMQFVTSHNGQFGLEFFSSMTQMVCTNTMRHAMHEAKAKLAFYHTKNAYVRLENAAAMLSIAGQEMKEFDDKLRFLATKRFTHDMMELVLDRLIGEVSPDDKSKRRANMRAEILSAPDNSETVKGISGTAYAFLNQITYIEDNSMPKTPQELKSYNEEKRVISASFGSGAKKKERAFELIFKLANGKEI